MQTGMYGVLEALIGTAFPAKWDATAAVSGAVALGQLAQALPPNAMGA